MSTFGYNFPFLSSTFVLPPQTDERIIKNDIKQLLLTDQGERVMRPDFGTKIRRTLFEPFDDRTLELLRDSIRNAIDRFEPRVSFRDVKFNTDPGNSYLEVIVIAALTRDPNRILTVDVNFFLGPGSISLPTQQQAI
jgi:uncharacterized protein